MENTCVKSVNTILTKKIVNDLFKFSRQVGQDNDIEDLLSTCCKG